ncbi:sm protein LSM7 [Trifolium repens]|nr:sm protein LSM7 [Trifolium repens]
MSGRKETVLDLAKFVDKGVQVKLTVTGTLKGYDQLLNLVLDEAVEFLRGKYYKHSTTTLFLLLVTRLVNCIYFDIYQFLVAIVPMLSSSFLYITHGNKMVSRDSR